MKPAFIILATAVFIVGGCASPPTVERRIELGSGFRQVMVAEPVHAGFEGAGHFEYLYYGDRRLCRLGSCSVAPSGGYVIFQDGPSGNLFLFQSADGSLRQLSSRFVAPVDRFEWHESEKTVQAYYAAGQGTQGSQTFSFP